MALQPMALQVKNPEIDAVGAFQQGQVVQSGLNAQKLQQTQQAMALLGSIAMGAMDGGIKGQPNPQKWQQGLDFLSSVSGGQLPIDNYRDPALIPVIARGSLKAIEQIQVAQNDREFELALAKFEENVENARASRGLAERKFAYQQEQDRLALEAAANGPVDPSSPLGKLAADFNAGLIDEDTYKAAVAKQTAQTQGMSLSVGSDGTTTFNMGGASQTGRNPVELGKKLSAEDAKMIGVEREQARAADDLSATVDQLEMVIGNVGYTGPGGEAYGKIDDLIGVLPGDAGARGAARSLGMEAQLAMTQKTKGAITDREMGMFKAAVPGLTQTEEGNQQIIAAMRGTAQRQKVRAQFMERYLEENGSLQNAQERWDSYIQANPLIERGPNGSLVVNPIQDPTAYITGDTSKMLPAGVTEEDMQHTMKIHGLTREEVLERLNAN